MKYIYILFLLMLFVGCENNSALESSIYPCEDAYKKELAPLKKLGNFDFNYARLVYDYRVSDKYLVTSGEINGVYKYIILNHQTGNFQYFERPYLPQEELPRSNHYQIIEDQLFLARLDRTSGCLLETINLESLESVQIPLVFGNKPPDYISQVDKLGTDIYIVALHQQSTVIYKFSTLNKSLIAVYNTDDNYYTTGVKAMRDHLNFDSFVRVAIDYSNNKTIVQRINPTLNQITFNHTIEGLARPNNYFYSKELLPTDSQDRIYLNFRDSKSVIIDGVTGRIISQSDKQILPISSEYSLSYAKYEENPITKFEIIDQKTGKIVIDFKLENKFNRMEIMNNNQLLIIDHYNWRVLNLNTGCIEFRIIGDCYKVNDTDFISISGKEIFYNTLKN